MKNGLVVLLATDGRFVWLLSVARQERSERASVSEAHGIAFLYLDT